MSFSPKARQSFCLKLLQPPYSPDLRPTDPKFNQFVSFLHVLRPKRNLLGVLGSGAS
jgi:hypothetical protein